MNVVRATFVNRCVLVGMVVLQELADQHRYRVPGVLNAAMTSLQLL